jgi:putative flippase GtrA
MTIVQRLARFGSVGVLGTIVRLTTVAVLDGAGLPAMASTLAGIAAAVAHNFAWHRHWTWADRTAGAGVRATFARFAAANGTMSVVGAVLVVPLLSRVPVVVANLVAILLVGLVNFVLSDRAVFVVGGWWPDRTS